MRSDKNTSLQCNKKEPEQGSLYFYAASMCMGSILTAITHKITGIEKIWKWISRLFHIQPDFFFVFFVQHAGDAFIGLEWV